MDERSQLRKNKSFRKTNDKEMEERLYLEIPLENEKKKQNLGCVGALRRGNQ